MIKVLIFEIERAAIESFDFNFFLRIGDASFYELRIVDSDNNVALTSKDRVINQNVVDERNSNEAFECLIIVRQMISLRALRDNHMSNIVEHLYDRLAFDFRKLKVAEFYDAEEDVIKAMIVKIFLDELIEWKSEQIIQNVLNRA